jgi:hypothetical protein
MSNNEQNIRLRMQILNNTIRTTQLLKENLIQLRENINYDNNQYQSRRYRRRNTNGENQPLNNRF